MAPDHIRGQPSTRTDHHRDAARYALTARRVAQQRRSPPDNVDNPLDVRQRPQRCPPRRLPDSSHRGGRIRQAAENMSPALQLRGAILVMTHDS